MTLVAWTLGEHPARNPFFQICPRQLFPTFNHYEPSASQRVLLRLLLSLIGRKPYPPLPHSHQEPHHFFTLKRIVNERVRHGAYCNSAAWVSSVDASQHHRSNEITSLNKRTKSREGAEQRAHHHPHASSYP